MFFCCAIGKKYLFATIHPEKISKNTYKISAKLFGYIKKACKTDKKPRGL